jgi:hypothetical protein
VCRVRGRSDRRCPPPSSTRSLGSSVATVCPSSAKTFRSILASVPRSRAITSPHRLTSEPTATCCTCVCRWRVLDASRAVAHVARARDARPGSRGSRSIQFLPSSSQPIDLGLGLASWRPSRDPVPRSRCPDRTLRSPPGATCELVDDLASSSRAAVDSRTANAVSVFPFGSPPYAWNAEFATDAGALTR